MNVAGENIDAHRTTIGLSVTEINQLFEQLYIATETNTKTSTAAKQHLKADVKELRSTVTETPLNESNLSSMSCLIRQFVPIGQLNLR